MIFLDNSFVNFIDQSYISYSQQASVIECQRQTQTERKGTESIPHLDTQPKESKQRNLKTYFGNETDIQSTGPFAHNCLTNGPPSQCFIPLPPQNQSVNYGPFRHTTGPRRIQAHYIAKTPINQPKQQLQQQKQRQEIFFN